MQKQAYYPPPTIHNDIVLRYFWKNIYLEDGNGLVGVIGKPGKCKSGSSITLSYLFDVSWNPTTKAIYYRWDLSKLVFDPQGFVRLINGNLPSGSAIVWDEIGVEHDARDYYTLKNKLIKRVMETFRAKNYLIFMTLPTIKSLDIGARRILTAYLHMKGKTDGGNCAVGDWHWYNTNPFDDKEYVPYPRFNDNDNDVSYTMRRYKIPRPPPFLEDEYKKIKMAKLKFWYDDIEKQLEFMEKFVQKGEISQQYSIVDLSNFIFKQDYKNFLDGKKFSPGLVEEFLHKEQMKISENRMQKLCALLNAKLRQQSVVVPANLPLAEGAAVE